MERLYNQNARLQVVDALRGFAIVSIMLLHNIEHFDFYFTPQNLPAWMISLDAGIWKTLFFLFGGKSYAIFALLFGVTFHIQSFNQKVKGNSFDARFAWRMLLLFLFGIINSAFFEGDILMFYAAIGLFLIPLGRLNNKVLLALACILLLLPMEWFRLVYVIQNPDLVISDPKSWSYFGKMEEYIPGNSLWNTWIGNLTNGRKAVLLWNYENGRFFLILSYFLFGILAARKNVFSNNSVNKVFWIRALIVSALLFIPFYSIQNYLAEWISSAVIQRSVKLYVSTFANTAFMVVLVSAFILLFHSKIGEKGLSYFSAFGKMSLSNYVFQSIVGSFIYYGFGLGLYKYTGATYSLLIGLVLAVMFGVFCTWWASKFKHGPLEGIWHQLTWLSFKRK